MGRPASPAADWPRPVETFRRYCRIVALFFAIAGGLGTLSAVGFWVVRNRRPEWVMLVLPAVYAAIGVVHGVAAFPRPERRWRRLALAAQILGLTNAITLLPAIWFLWRFRKADVRDWVSGATAPIEAAPRRA